MIIALPLSHLEDLALDALPTFQRVEPSARMAGSAAPAVFDDLILHIAPDKFYLESLSSTQSVLVIDRISYEISLQVKIIILVSQVYQLEESLDTVPLHRKVSNAHLRDQQCLILFQLSITSLSEEACTHH